MAKALRAYEHTSVWLPNGSVRDYVGENPGTGRGLRLVCQLEAAPDPSGRDLGCSISAGVCRSYPPSGSRKISQVASDHGNLRRERIFLVKARAGYTQRSHRIWCEPCRRYQKASQHGLVRKRHALRENKTLVIRRGP